MFNNSTVSVIDGGADAWGECRVTHNCDQGFSGGCSDGCLTMYHCTDGYCTTDCTGIPKETTSGGR